MSLARQYLSANHLFGGGDDDDTVQYSKVLEVDLNTVEPCVSGPKRPHDRIPLSALKDDFEACMNAEDNGFKGFGRGPGWEAQDAGKGTDFQDGSLVVASITSCTNTSNPNVMIGAGLVAKKAIDHSTLPPPLSTPFFILYFFIFIWCVNLRSVVRMLCFRSRSHSGIALMLTCAMYADANIFIRLRSMA